MSKCDTCVYFDYDEIEDYYYCMFDLDEDEMVDFLSDNTVSCPYYRYGYEYELAHKQGS